MKLQLFKNIIFFGLIILFTIASLKADENDIVSSISSEPILLPLSALNETDCFLQYPDTKVRKQFNENYFNFNVLDLSIISSNKNQFLNNEPKDKDYLIYGLSFDTYNDYHFGNNFSIHTSLNFTTFSKSFYNETIDNKLELKNELTITEARLKYIDDYNNVYTVGILPMFRGITYKYDNFDFTRNDGSQYITGLILQGFSITHRFGNDDPLFLSYGYGWYEKIHINNIELHTKQMRGSNGQFLYAKKLKKIDEYSRIEYNGELTKINYLYNGELGYEQILTGHTLTYFDDSNTIWGYIGYQWGKGDNTNLVRKQLHIPNSIPDSYFQTNTKDTFIGPYKIEGGNLAVGYKRSFDIGKTENFILGEYYQTFGEWVSPNIGTPFSAYGLGNLGYQYKLSYGHFVNKNFLTKLTYYDTHYTSNHMYGGSMKQIDVNINGTKDREQQIIVNIEFLF